MGLRRWEAFGAFFMAQRNFSLRAHTNKTVPDSAHDCPIFCKMLKTNNLQSARFLSVAPETCPTLPDFCPKF
jgi:hypothetical protein